jgi:F-box protein 18 (helicase)
MNPTEEQKAVIDRDLSRSEALKVIAFAGTGKTSTLVEYAKARPMDQMLYVAFNKSVQLDAEAKFPANVQCRTIHSLAFQSVGRKFQNIGNVPFFLITKMFGVDVYRATLISRTLDNWFNSADDQIEEKHVPPDVLGRFEKGFEPRIVDAAELLWEKMKQDEEKVPMTHSGYLKLYQLSKPVLRFDTILLDESQDTNPVTFDILRRQREDGARFILVGDPYQQIYSWRGASDAMDMIDCPILHLTQSFRFGPAVASVANKLLSTFFGNKVPVRGHTIEDGVVENHGSGKVTVICRTNQELFRSANTHAELSKAIAVVGGVGFENFMDKLMDVFHLYSGNRSAIKERQVAFFKAYADLVKFAQDRLDAELASRVNIVNDFRDGTPYAIQRIRQKSVGEQASDVLLVTGHKSKGLEWDNVSLAEDFAELFDEKRQPFAIGEMLPKDEINLLYVASTRAKKALRLNAELRSLMAWSPDRESDDLTDQKQCEEVFLSKNETPE